MDKQDVQKFLLGDRGGLKLQIKTGGEYPVQFSTLAKKKQGRQEWDFNGLLGCLTGVSQTVLLRYKWLTKWLTTQVETGGVNSDAIRLNTQWNQALLPCCSACWEPIPTLASIANHWNFLEFTPVGTPKTAFCQRNCQQPGLKAAFHVMRPMARVLPPIAR